MKIINHTKWDTNDLRAIFTRCQQEVARVENKNKFGFDVKVMNRTYGGAISGRASVGGYWMMIRLPVKRELWSRVRLAQVFIHEFYHLLGYKHWDYRNYRGDLTKSWNVDWVKEYPIKEKVAPAKQDLQLFRYEHSKKMFERKERALKRLQTSLRKWKQKVRRYETVMAKRANS